MSERTEEIVGYSVFAGGTESCVASIAEWIAHGDRVRWLACLNPHSYAVALKSSAFADALKDADWLVPDGAGVVFASVLHGGAIRERVTGSDVFLGVHKALNMGGKGRVFFLGSTEETLVAMRAKMAVDFPRVEVVGTCSPPYKASYAAAEIDAMVADINRARPDVLWVAMTAPKQELWIHLVRSRLQVKFAAAVGAVFDFYTGRIRRSAPAFQRAGLEWLPRLLQEPRRLWRRMFVSAPVFVWHVLKERARRRATCR